MAEEGCGVSFSLLPFKNREAGYDGITIKREKENTTFHLLTIKMQSSSAAGALLFPRSINGSPDFNKH